MLKNHDLQEALLLDAAGGHRKKGASDGRLRRRITERANKRANRKSNSETSSKGFGNSTEDN